MVYKKWLLAARDLCMLLESRWRTKQSRSTETMSISNLCVCCRSLQLCVKASRNPSQRNTSCSTWITAFKPRTGSAHLTQTRSWCRPLLPKERRGPSLKHKNSSASALPPFISHPDLFVALLNVLIKMTDIQHCFLKLLFIIYDVRSWNVWANICA